MKLENYTSTELQDELSRRETELAPPVPFELDEIHDDNRDIGIYHMALNYVKHLAEKGYTNDDAEHYIFEGVMGMVYGDAVWSYINAMARR